MCIRDSFLSMAISHGMTSAIMNPLHAEVKTAIQAADVLSGQDANCAAWIETHRDPDASSRTRRSGRRRS